MLNDRDFTKARIPWRGYEGERGFPGPRLAAGRGPRTTFRSRERDDTKTVRDPKRKRLPINKKPAYLSVVFHADRIDYRSGPKEVANGTSHSLSFPPPARSPHPCPLLIFLPFAGLSFVKLDNLVPSLRAITLDYFCLQSRAPPYTYSLEMIVAEPERERTMREGEQGGVRERHEKGGYRNKKRKEGIAERSERSSVHFRLIAGMCAGRAKG